MLNLVKFCCQKPKTLQITSIWGERVFFTEKYIFYFVSTVFSKIVGYEYFLKNYPKLLNGIEMYFCALYALNSINFNLQK